MQKQTRRGLAMLVVLEGLDGVGKSLQSRLLQERLAEDDWQRHHFPQHGQQPFGQLITQFLQGQLGDVKTMNSYLVALLFACDQFALAKNFNKNNNIILDRYYYSNMAYQAAKLASAQEQEDFCHWLETVVATLELPTPDVVFYLELPEAMLVANLQKRKEYGNMDAYEADRSFQQTVAQVYGQMCQRYENFIPIDCCHADGTWRLAQDIHTEIFTHMQRRLGLCRT